MILYRADGVYIRFQAEEEGRTREQLVAECFLQGVEDHHPEKGSWKVALARASPHAWTRLAQGWLSHFDQLSSSLILSQLNYELGSAFESREAPNVKRLLDLNAELSAEVQGQLERQLAAEGVDNLWQIAQVKTIINSALAGVTAICRSFVRPWLAPAALVHTCNLSSQYDFSSWWEDAIRDYILADLDVEFRFED